MSQALTLTVDNNDSKYLEAAADRYKVGVKKAAHLFRDHPCRGKLQNIKYNLGNDIQIEVADDDFRVTKADLLRFTPQTAK